jgi:hypothetical protein
MLGLLLQRTGCRGLISGEGRFTVEFPEVTASVRMHKRHKKVSGEFVENSGFVLSFSFFFIFIQ